MALPTVKLMHIPRLLTGLPCCKVADCWAACHGNIDTAAVTQFQAQAIQLSKQAISVAQRQLHVTQQQVCHA